MYFCVLLITRSSATAEKQRVSCPLEGGRPSSPLPLLLIRLHLCVWSNLKPATSVRQTCRLLSALLNESGIQGHSRSSFWCRHESRTVCRRNVQLMPTLFLKLTKIRQRDTANSSISTIPLKFEDVPARNACK